MQGLRRRVVLGTVTSISLLAAGSTPLRAVPGRDGFAYRHALLGASGRTAGSTLGRSKEAGEPDHAGNPGGASVWWTWRAPATGRAAFRTAGSDFDTLLAVYSGRSLDDLVLIAEDDDGGPGGSSAVSFDVTFGDAYEIAVDGAGGDMGRVVLEWRLTGPDGRPIEPPPPEATPGPKMIFGKDDRIDIYRLEDPAALEAYESTVLLVSQEELQRKGDTYTITGEPYGESHLLCTTVVFWSQPSRGFCSGFLVAPDLVATAGHCIETEEDCADTAIIFGYRMKDASTPILEFPASDVYFCAGIVGRELEDEGEDWAVLRLDRPVPDRRPLEIRRAGAIAMGTQVAMIGHPSGLPSKFNAGGAKVLGNGHPAYFECDLDGFQGNSGGATFDASTFLVEGVVVRGNPEHWVQDPGQQCFLLKVCSTVSAECEATEIARTTLFSHLIPEQPICRPPSELSACQDVFGPGAENSVSIAWKNGTTPYLGLEASVDGLPLDPPLEGSATGFRLEGIPPGDHVVLLEADCGEPAGTARAVSLGFTVRASPPTADPPTALACKFSEYDFSAIRLTWRNPRPAAAYYEVSVIDAQGQARVAATVAGVSTGTTIEGTVSTDRAGIRPFYEASGSCFSGDLLECTPEPPDLPPGFLYLRGDCDGGGFLVITDAVFALNFLFRGGDAPPCEAACDANLDELFNLTDPIYTLQHLFLGGPPPLGKFPECDETTPDQAATCPADTCAP